MVGPSSQISKILLTLLFLIIIFFIWMDINLYLRIQHYPVERNFHINLSTPSSVYSSSSSLSSSSSYVGGGSSSIAITPTIFNQSQQQLQQHNSKVINYNDVTWVSCNINPLCDVTVKGIMLDHTNHYIFAPLAIIFDQLLSISKNKLITPNMISVFHVFVAISAGRMVASDNLGYRRFGVILFQVRTFLDDLDGHVARMLKNIRGERSEIGTSGYYMDGICDGLGCIALMIGVFIYLKNNPPRRGYTQLQSIIPITGGNNGTGSDNNNSDTLSSVIYKVKVTTKKVGRKILCFSGQLLLSSTAWNRYIALYQDMLERNDVTGTEFMRQNLIFKSQWLFLVAWLWRIVNVHALLHYLLLSIFCDKLWEFLRTIQYAGYVVLLVIICISEMHVLEVQNFIFKSLTGNSTSL